MPIEKEKEHRFRTRYGFFFLFFLWQIGCHYYYARMQMFMKYFMFLFHIWRVKREIFIGNLKPERLGTWYLRAISERISFRHSTTIWQPLHIIPNERSFFSRSFFLFNLLLFALNASESVCLFSFQFVRLVHINIICIYVCSHRFNFRHHIASSSSTFLACTILFAICWIIKLNEFCVWEKKHTWTNAPKPKFMGSAQTIYSMEMICLLCLILKFE